MNPLASGAFLIAVAGVKLLVKVWVVSPAKGMGGRAGPRLAPPAPGPPAPGPPGPGPCAKALSCSPNKTTRAITGKK